MISNTQLLAIAKKQIGNTGGKYRNYVHASGSWCDMFVFWLYDANGCGSLLPWKGQQKTYCPASIKWCRENLAEIPLYLAMPCDIFYMDWDNNGVPNHIGIAEAHDTTAAIYTIEGNTSGGKVDDKHRAGKYNCGLFRPHFRENYKDKNLTVDGNYGFQSIGATQKALKMLGYYKGEIDTILGKSSVKAIQALCGAKQDGAWGTGTSGNLQSYLKKKGYYTGKIDKQFGKQSVIALQKWVNAVVFSNSKQNTPVKKGYNGTFPVIPKAKIIECTRSVNGMRKHDLISGDYILRFKSEERRYKMCKFSLATVNNGKITYSNHPKFEDKVKTFGYNLAKVKALKTSANCSNFIDGAVGAVTGKYVRDLGAKKNKSYLAKTNFFYSLKYSKSALLAGDICGTSKHTWMIIQGSALSIGCEGSEVKKWQNYLNWVGFNCGTPDGDFGMNTLKQTKAFQNKYGLTQDGIVGKKTLDKAKAVKK